MFRGEKSAKTHSETELGKMGLFAAPRRSIGCITGRYYSWRKVEVPLHFCFNNQDFRVINVLDKIKDYKSIFF